MKKKIVAITLACVLVATTTGALANPGKGKGSPAPAAPGIQKQVEKQVEKQIEKQVEKQVKKAVPAVKGKAEKIERYAAIDAKKVKVKGGPVHFDVPPVIKEGRTLIPVRAVTQGLGAAIDYDSENLTVTITRDDVEIVIVLGSNVAYVNGEPVEIDAPAGLINNRTFVPLRFIVEALGEKISYDPETGDVNIGDEEEVDEENKLVEDVDEEDDSDEEEATEVRIELVE